MKILIVTQYFWPENFLINELTLKLSESGHSIVVLTGKPNYPKGEIFRGYKQKGISKDQYGKIEIIRFPVRVRSTGPFNLILNYLSFIYCGLTQFKKKIDIYKFDIIFVYAPSPILQVLPAIYLKKKFKIPLALWVQDLWPESIMATGYVKSKLIINLVRKLVTYIYKETDLILGQSKSFVDEINKYTSKSKILFFPNCIKDFKSENKLNLLPPHIKEVFLKDFKVVFTGNLGQAQSIPTILDAAENLVESKVRFIFVGNGSLSQWTQKNVKTRDIKNVYFIDQLDFELIPSIYDLADTLLLSLSKDNILSKTIPSKLQSYLVAGKPIIASLDGEAGEIIKTARCGFVSEAENSAELTKNILELKNTSLEKRKQMGVNGRNYFEKNYNLHNQAKKLEKMFLQQIGIK